MLLDLDPSMMRASATGPASTQAPAAGHQRWVCEHQHLRPSPMLALTADPGRTTEDHNSACSHQGPCTVFTKVHAVVNAVNPKEPEPETSCLPGSSAATCYHIHTRSRCPAPLDPESQNAPVCLPPTFENFPLWMAVHKSKRGDCFFKCTNTCTRLPGTWRIREIWLHQRNTVNL